MVSRPPSSPVDLAKGKTRAPVTRWSRNVRRLCHGLVRHSCAGQGTFLALPGLAWGLARRWPSTAFARRSFRYPVLSRRRHCRAFAALKTDEPLGCTALRWTASSPPSSIAAGASFEVVVVAAAPVPGFEPKGSKRHHQPCPSGEVRSWSTTCRPGGAPRRALVSECGSGAAAGSHPGSDHTLQKWLQVFREAILVVIRTTLTAGGTGTGEA